MLRLIYLRIFVAGEIVIYNLRTPDLSGNQLGLRTAFDAKWCQENWSAKSETR
jgi:hypothetical protein